MNRFPVTTAHLEAQAKRRPSGYIDRLLAAKVEELPGVIVFDADHPVWQQLAGAECVHRAEAIGEMPCVKCKSKSVRLKIFACQVRGRCAIGQSGEGVVDCLSCNARVGARAVGEINFQEGRSIGN